MCLGVCVGWSEWRAAISGAQAANTKRLFLISTAAFFGFDMPKTDCSYQVR